MSQSVPAGPMQSRTGRWIERHKFPVCAALGALFWGFRSQTYAGDGDQIVRMVESGVWMVHSELLSKASFQAAYQILRPWGWDGFAAVNLITCLAGAASAWMLLVFNQIHARTDPLWALGLFFSSGFLIFCAGHTEYYTQFLFALFWYGHMGANYLSNRSSMLAVSLVFSFGAWIHMGILFALPSLLALPWLKGRNADTASMAMGLLPVAGAFVLKYFHNLLGFEVHGLSQGDNFIPLFYDPAKEWSYTLFQFEHFADWIFGWTARSWIFWPAVLWALWTGGRRALDSPAQRFLLVFTLCFTLFSFIWHPNLGIRQDWDLFAIEAAPCLMLLLTCLPVLFERPARRTLLAVPVVASILIGLIFITRRAQFDLRGYGSAELGVPRIPEINVTFNGHLKSPDVPAIRRGEYSVKIIDARTREVYDLFAHIAPGARLAIPVELKPPAERGP